MKNSHLLNLLEKLSPEDLKGLAEYINSPFHNRNPSIKLLYEFLMTTAPKFKENKITKELAFQYIFPGKPFNDLKIRHLMSELMRLAGNFLVYQSVSENSVLQSILLLRKYREMNLPTHFTKVSNSLDSVFSETAYPGNLREKYEILRERSDWTEANEGRPSPELLQAGTDALDQDYFLNKLRQSCLMVNQRNLLVREFRLDLLDEILNWLEKNPSREPLIQAYHFALLSLLYNEEEAHFQSLRKILEEMGIAISRKEGMELHVIARNYCIRKMNDGNEPYIRHLFDLYKSALENGFLMDQTGEFPASAFKNIVSTGLKLKEFEWTEDFIRKWSEALTPEMQVNFLNFSLARLEFEKKNFSAVIRYANNILFTDLFIILDTKTLFAKTYYEQGEFEMLESHLSSFRRYIQRRELKAYHKENYLNIIRLMKALIELNPFNLAEKAAFREKVTAIQVLTEKAWFLEKLV